ncbi:MAG TPA: sigma-70 family RNA polymerase sigma factor, partial [Clostridium sp.]|nr:sigma-70 family RNA polymerase sigma factor [Clostridium sp.]
LSKLDKKESELIDSIFFQGTTVKNYAKEKDLSYSTIIKRKRSILNKLFNHINITNSSDNNPKIY